MAACACRRKAFAYHTQGAQEPCSLAPSNKKPPRKRFLYFFEEAVRFELSKHIFFIFQRLKITHPTQFVAPCCTTFQAIKTFKQTHNFTSCYMEYPYPTGHLNPARELIYKLHLRAATPSTMLSKTCISMPTRNCAIAGAPLC